MSSRGALGAPIQKHRSQNVNSVFSGKNTAVRPNKHGGLQALGKTTTIVRRMPKPATLPSLKAEHGQDPQVCLVPQGGQGWLKSTEQQSIDSKTGVNLSELNSIAGGGPDLRPNWAKQSQPASNALATINVSNSSTNLLSSSAGDINAQQTQANSAQSGTVDNRDYPSLAVSMKWSGAAEQKLKTAQEEEIVPLPNVVQPLPAGYIGASGPRISDRKLPERYYGGPEISRRKSGQKYNFLQKISKLSLETKEQPQNPVSSTPAASVTVTTTNSTNITREKSSLTASVVDLPISKISDKESQDISQDSVLQKHINQSHVSQSNQKTQLFGETLLTNQLQQAATRSTYGNTESLQCLSSELTNDLATTGTYKKRIYDPILTNQQRYGNEQSCHLQHQYQHHHQQQHQDSQLTGAPQNGRGDIGYGVGNQASDIQKHQHPPLRNFEQRTSISRDILESGLQSNGNASIYDYSTPPPTHHATHYPPPSRHQYDEQSPSILSYESGSSISGNYRRVGEEVTTQHYRNMPYNNNRSGVIDEKLNQHWDDINKNNNEFTQQKFQGHTRQPLLSSQPPQSQQVRYCMDSRHTSESESGWYAPLNNLQQQSQGQSLTSQGGRRGNSSYSQNGSNSVNGGWYANGSSTNNNVSHYPPSLLSLETGVIDTYENSNGSNSRFVSNNRYGSGNHYHHSNEGSRISLPRNGPVTSSYIVDERFVNREDLQANQQNSNVQKVKSNNSRRVLGTELSYASENDSHASGTYLNDFFEDSNDIMLDKLPNRQKNLWERTCNNAASYNQRDHCRDQQQFKSSEKSEESQAAPQFRMLKRNDEKSAEYFAHYSTPNILSSENNGDNVNIGRDDFDNHTNYNGNHQYNSNKKSLNQKNNAKSEDTSVSNQFNLDYSHQMSHSNDTQHAHNFQQKDYSKKTQNQNFGSGAAVLSVQQQHKFNRAPGGGKPLQHNHQPQILTNTSGTNKVVQIASNNDFLEKSGNNTGAQLSGSTNTTKSALLAAPTSSANVWEKRKEERQSLEPKTTQQTKQNRQFDYHFPTMSDAAKYEPNLSNENNNLQRGSLNEIKYQDVRLSQNHYNDRQHGHNQWNSPEPNAESHWDKFAPTTNFLTEKKNDKRRRNERQNRNDLESKAINSNTGDNLMSLRNNTYDGVRREFVNSKNRVPLSGKSTRRTSNIKTHRLRDNYDAQRANTRNNDRKNHNRSDSNKLQKNTLTANPIEKHYDNVSKDHKSNDSQRNRRNKGDNFSNMGEFHAEDYKILAESVEQNKKRDGKTRSNENKDLKSRKGNKFSGNEFSDKRSVKIGNGVYVGRSWRGTLVSATTNSDSTTTEKLKEINTAENKTNENNIKVDVSNDEKNEKIVNEKRESQHQRRNRSRRIQGRNQNSQIRNNGSRFVQRQSANRPVLTRIKDKFVHNESKTGRNLGDRATQIKSPVISDGGVEEWETASESSDFAGRADDYQNAQNFHSKAPDREKKSNLLSNGITQTNSNRRNVEFSDQKLTQQKNAGQKNVKPASHTYQGNVVSVKNSNSNNNNKNGESVTLNPWKNNTNKNARESRKGTSKNSFSSKNGLAGVDINDASVVVIDYHPDLFASESHSESGDFEEVLSRKSKRQRLQQQEEERRKLEREKERQEKILAKRTKQQQKRNERTTSRKSNFKKEKKELTKITVFTNQNFVTRTENNSIIDNALHSFSSSKSNASQNDVIKNNKLSSNKSTNLLDSFISSSLSNSNLFVGSGNTMTKTGFDEIVMPTVWNNTLSTSNSSSSVPTTLVMICESNLSNTIIPSPIARPVPKNSNSNSAKSTNVKTDIRLDKKFADTTLKSGNEKYEFTFDPSLKEALSVNKSNEIDVRNCYDSLHESSLSQHSLNSPVNVNSDHAQLQKKLDKVKDFWPGIDLKVNVSTKQATTNLALNNIGSNSDTNIGKMKVQSNNSKQQEVSITSSIISTTTTAAPSTFSSQSGGTFVSTQAYSFPNNSNSKGINNLSNLDFDINRTGGINFVEINNTSTNRCVSANLATPQSPVTPAVFGNPLFALGNISNGQSSQVSGLPPYSIMLPNGDFVTHLSSHHSASSPPIQHIMGQPGTGLIGAQRPSRSNTFIDQHALIMTHNQPPVSNTPWSTNGGFEFLNGIGATPPPLSVPVSGNVVGRSSVPPHNGGFHSATLTQHFVAPLSVPSSLSIHAQQAQTFNGNSTIAGNARNGNGILTVSGAHLHHPPPPHLFTSSTTILQPPPINKLGTGPNHGAIVSMPPPHFPPPIQLGPSFMPSPSPFSSSLDWANVQPIISNNVTGSQAHNSSLQGISQMPSMMHPPPSFLPPQSSDVRNRPQMVKIGLYFKNI